MKRNLSLAVLIVSLIAMVMLVAYSSYTAPEPRPGVQTYYTRSNGEALLISIQKIEYARGERVLIGVINMGNTTFTFLSSSLGLEMIDSKGSRVYSFPGVDEVTELKPDDHVEFVWDQRTEDGSPAGPGYYMVRLNIAQKDRIIPVTAGFSIKG